MTSHKMSYEEFVLAHTQQPDPDDLSYHGTNVNERATLKEAYEEYLKDE